MTNSSDAASRAADHAAQAAAIAATLKPGTYEAVKALALLSIAESLLARADD